MPLVFSALHNPGTHGPFRPITPALDARGAQRVIATDANGTYHAYRLTDGRIVAESLVTPSAAKIAADAAAATAAATKETKASNNIDRLRTLGRRAARYAKDPVANVGDDLLPGVTNGNTKRLTHELMARCALTLVAEFSDDV